MKDITTVLIDKELLELLPDQTYKNIKKFLEKENPDYAALKIYVRLLFRKTLEAEAKLEVQARRIRMYERTFQNWKPVIDRLRKDKQNETPF